MTDQPRLAPDSIAALEAVGKPDVVVIDLPTPAEDAASILKQVRDQMSDLQYRRGKFKDMNQWDREWWMANAINIVISVMLEDRGSR